MIIIRASSQSSEEKEKLRFTLEPFFELGSLMKAWRHNFLHLKPCICRAISLKYSSCRQNITSQKFEWKHPKLHLFMSESASMCHSLFWCPTALRNLYISCCVTAWWKPSTYLQVTTNREKLQAAVKSLLFHRKEAIMRFSDVFYTNVTDNIK